MFGQTDIETGFIKSTRMNVSNVKISISLCPNYSVLSIYVILMVSMSVFYAIVYFSIIQSPQNSRLGWVQTHTFYLLDTGPKFIGLVSSNAGGGESFSVIYLCLSDFGYLVSFRRYSRAKLEAVKSTKI